MLKCCNWIWLLWSLLIPSLSSSFVTVLPALSLAMGRDNVSGGVVHLVVITETGVEHVVVPGDKLPKFHDEWRLQRPIKVSLTKRVGSIFFSLQSNCAKYINKAFFVSAAWQYVEVCSFHTLEDFDKTLNIHLKDILQLPMSKKNLLSSYWVFNHRLKFCKDIGILQVHCLQDYIHSC